MSQYWLIFDFFFYQTSIKYRAEENLSLKLFGAAYEEPRPHDYTILFVMPEKFQINDFRLEISFQAKCNFNKSSQSVHGRFKELLNGKNVHIFCIFISVKFEVVKKRLENLFFTHRNSSHQPCERTAHWPSQIGGTVLKGKNSSFRVDFAWSVGLWILMGVCTTWN